MQEYIDIQEQIDPSIRYALIEQFPRPAIALLEITDNSIATKVPDRPLELRIRITPGHISITDKWGLGMDAEGLRKFLRWGAGERVGIFRFHGQGGKAALAHLAKNFTLYSTPANNGATYKAIVSDWSANLDTLRTIRFSKVEAMFDFPTVSFELSGLRKTIPTTELKRILAETYRPLLVEDTVRIWVNNSRLVPADVPSTERVEFSEKTRFGLVKGWVGLKPEGSPIRGGIRCYTQGRLVSRREFFGLDEPSVDFEHLIGEVDLQFVPVTTLKTQFDQASQEWLAATMIVIEKLKPFVRRTTHIGKELRHIDKELVSVKQEILNIFQIGDETFGLGGRKPPEHRGQGQTREEAEHTARPRRLQTPRPPHPVGSSRRLGNFDLASLAEDIRSYYDGEGDVILVNRNFPASLATARLYRQDPRPFIGHIVESIALEWYTRDGTPPSEIKERVNHLLKLAYQRVRSQS